MSLFEGVLSTPEMLSVFSERSLVDAMLRFEAALARSQARLGIIPESAAQSIAGSCKVELFDVAKMVRDGARGGSVAAPLLHGLKEAVGLFNADAMPFVHFGIGDQDLVDTAMALLTREAVALVEADLAQAVQALLRLAERHAETPMLARTSTQPTSVTSFGLVCAAWAAPLARSRGRLAQAAHRGLQVQLGGAGGTLDRMQGQGAALRRQLADALGLRDPGVAWHTQRDEWLAIGCELGLMVGSLGMLGKDLLLLGQHEIGEVAEPAESGRGERLPLAHRSEPRASMVALAAAQRAPQRVAALLAAMPQAHPGALGGWQAELAEWPQLLLSAHGSVRALAGALPGLHVDAARMRSNIDRLRSGLPRGAAAEGFDPALAETAGVLALAQVLALQSPPDLSDDTR
ncbi:lyase family protein [Variovorax saccharolyticus]|uniref:lyase family protein n=1 Tax=Variovorax saccharolyticus TaxID=3053516 RepID=UPI002575E78B|nr:lyase family protein [Variovorax sp. J31P216]MDM0023015.1 lyase family protein [Variovorax sp. J31P216]